MPDFYAIVKIAKKLPPTLASTFSPKCIVAPILLPVLPTVELSSNMLINKVNIKLEVPILEMTKLSQQDPLLPPSGRK